MKCVVSLTVTLFTRWCEDHTHQAILTTGLLELEGWQLNAKIEMVAIVDALHSGYMKLLKGLLGNKNII